MNLEHTEAALAFNEVHTDWASVVLAVATYIGEPAEHVARWLAAAIRVNVDISVHDFLAIIGVVDMDELDGELSGRSAS